MSENKNAALWFVDRHVGEGRGENLAFREADGARRMQTYAQLAQRSNLIAGAFAVAGLRREERVACLILDQLEYPEVFWRDQSWCCTGPFKHAAGHLGLCCHLERQSGCLLDRIARDLGDCCPGLGWKY